MSTNIINNTFKKTEDNMTKTYEVKLNLTASQISAILDYRLGQRIEHESGDIEDLLSTAECIKSSNLSDEFCQTFAAELVPLLTELVGSDSDSYEITNFQHRMLRKFADCAATKKVAQNR